jgi:hypothetical protein
VTFCSRARDELAELVDAGPLLIDPLLDALIDILAAAA